MIVCVVCVCVWYQELFQCRLPHFQLAGVVLEETGPEIWKVLE